jgi:hypothetical protein
VCGRGGRGRQSVMGFYELIGKVRNDSFFFRDNNFNFCIIVLSIGDWLVLTMNYSCILHSNLVEGI